MDSSDVGGDAIALCMRVRRRRRRCRHVERHAVDGLGRQINVRRKGARTKEERLGSKANKLFRNS